MKNNYIVIRDGSGTFRIAYESILFVAVSGHYCQLQTSELSYSIKCSLMELLEGPARKFLVQVHRSFAVNMRQVTGICRREVFIHIHRIPIGRAYYKEVAEQFVNTT